MELKNEILKDAFAIKIVAIENGEELGWAYLYILKNDRHEEPFGLLENLYVKPDTRGKGVGTKLVEAVISKAKEQGCYKLIATSRNSKAELQDFYSRFGLGLWGVEYRLNLKDSRINQAEACEIK